MNYKLKDIFDLQMGKTPARDNAEYWCKIGHKWLSIADLSKSEKYIYDTKESISDVAVKETKIKLIPINTVIMSFKLSIGKVAITGEDMYSNEAIMAFRDKNIVEILPEYIFYMFKHKQWDVGSNNAVMGKTLNKATMAEIKINVESIEEQKKIIGILGKIDSIITYRKQEIALLDDIVKARFVEMFGKCNNKMSIDDICLMITDGTHQAPEFQRSGIPFIFVSNLANNRVTYCTEKFISDVTYNVLIKRTPIEVGDVLLTTVGSYGHPAVVVEDKKFLFQRHIAYLKPDHNIVNSFFLHSALLTLEVQRQIEDKVKGIAQKTLNLSEIRKIIIPIPNIKLQNEFANFVHQVDKSKAVIEKSLKELETLQASLMQEYFS